MLRVTELKGTSASGWERIAISDDGRFVAFDSFAENLVAGDTNPTIDVFVYDRVSGSTEMAFDLQVANGPVTVTQVTTAKTTGSRFTIAGSLGVHNVLLALEALPFDSNRIVGNGGSTSLFSLRQLLRTPSDRCDARDTAHRRMRFSGIACQPWGSIEGLPHSKTRSISSVSYESILILAPARQ